MDAKMLSRRAAVQLALSLYGAHRSLGQTAEQPAVDLNKLVSLPDVEATAKARISPSVYDRVGGAAGDEVTLRWNREGYDRIKLRTRVLRDVSKLDTKVQVLGQTLDFPILLAPTGGHHYLHPDAEIATARGAAAAGAVLVMSTAAAKPLDQIVAASKGPLWFQLYMQEDREFTRDLVQRAESLGSRVLCVTVDRVVPGARDRETKATPSLPPRPRPNMEGARPVSGGARAGRTQPQKLTWDDIAWLQSFSKTPVILKGILSPEDAEMAVQTKVAGIIVSNHGARQLDTVPATIEALPLVVEKVKGRIAVLVDGGIRRGTDVVKAIALGANAVLIGRPYLYGLGVGGPAGVERVVDLLRTELEMTMALTGCPTIASISRKVIW